jgi:hypothetical protein
MPAPGFFDFNNFDPDFNSDAETEVAQESTELETNNNHNDDNHHPSSTRSTSFRPVVLPGGKGRGNTTATGKAKVLHRDPSP